MLVRAAIGAFAATFAIACSQNTSPGDGGADLSSTDQGIPDLAGVDLAGADLTGSRTTLIEGPCPASLNNGRCYYPPGVDLGFY
jgi:hypothetical protein